MAANEFTAMLHKNCHKIIVILVYAVLEWILILLLLLNSFFSYLIAKLAKFFGLKQSCTWCARLDHVFDSKSIAKKPHFDHVCEAHGAELSKMSYCSRHSRLTESKNLCFHCSSSGVTNDVSSTVAFFALMSESASEGGEEDTCSCCDQILTKNVHPQPLVLKPSWDLLLEYFQKNKIGFEADLMETKTEFQENVCKEANDNQRVSAKDDKGSKKAEDVEESLNLEVQEWSCSQTTTDEALWNLGCNEDDESVYIADMLLQNAELMDSDRFICIELIDTDSTQMPLLSSSEDVGEGREEIERPPVEALEEYEERIQGIEIDGDEAAGVQQHSDEVEETEGGRVESLKSTIEEQEKALNALYAELEEERKAAAEAAQETMAMITKLQEEKAAMQMEALQYQRMMEEQAEYDQEALQLLNDLMLKREKEKKELEKELEVYRARRRNGSLMRRTASNASSNNSIDLGSDDEYDNTQFGTHQHHNFDDSLEELQAEDLECIPDISIAEFDEERLSILEELKVVEAKLFNLHDGDDDVMAKKLLPLLDAAENESAEEVHDKEEITNQSSSMTSNLYEGNSMMLMQEEIGHVYERLQALEADKDFLKHCIRSMMKGNQGMGLLQEILQHLRDLKSAELSATNMADVPLPYATVDGEDREEEPQC